MAGEFDYPAALIERHPPVAFPFANPDQWKVYHSRSADSGEVFAAA